MKFTAQNKGFTFLRSKKANTMQESFLFLAKSSTGFTLLELVLVMTLFGIVLAVGVVTLVRPVSEAKAEGVSQEVISLLQDAQNRAMNSDIGEDSTADPWGVHFETDSYTLFEGSIYSESGSGNFTVELPQNINLTFNLTCNSPPSDCNNVVFQPISGEISGFSSSNNTVCVENPSVNESIQISFNALGVVNVQNSC